MTKIATYINDEAVELTDRLIGTDQNGSKTKNYQIKDIVSLVNGVAGKDYIQYQFSLTDYLSDGSFTTNTSKTDPTEITKLFLNNQSVSLEDLTSLFTKLDTLQNIAISLRNPANTNNFATFKVTNITSHVDYFELDVVLYKNFYAGVFLAGTIYSAYFDVKENFDDKIDKFIKSNESLTLSQRKGDTLYGILDQYTGEQITLSKVTGTPTVDGVIYFQLGTEYFKREFDYISCEWFGALGNGVADDTTAIQNALNSLAITGGELRFLAKKYLISGQINIPYDGNTVTPKMASIILRGAGSGHTGRGTAPVGGTQLDMRFSGSNGKIIGLGLGFLRIQDIAFIDGGSDATPFIYGTNPTMHISDCSFYGTKNGALADQDAIVLGGTLEVEGFNGILDGFQGYGTVIERNYFGKIRRAVYGRVFFNGNVIQNNTIWNNCGTNISTYGAIEIDGNPTGIITQKSVGNIISGNLIESTHYPYSIVLNASEGNSFIANNFFDKSSESIYYYNFSATAVYNYILDGYRNDTLPLINTPALSANTIITAHQSQESTFSQPQKFLNTVINKSEFGDSAITEDPYGNKTYTRLENQDRLIFYKKLLSGSESELMQIRDFGGGIQRFNIAGTDTRIDANDKLRVRSGGDGSELYLGNQTGKYILIIDGRVYSYIANGIGIQPFRILSKTAVENLTVQRIDNGTLVASDENATTGAKIFTGTGTPEGILSALVGSFFTRTDGGAGTTFYVKESGTGNTGWVAK